MENIESYYGLPREVKFCIKCVNSNQRPLSTNEYEHNSKSKKDSLDFDKSENFRSRTFWKFYFYEIFREAQGSLWDVSGTCSEMFSESAKSKFRGHFFKEPFSASHSRGNLVDGLPRGVSTEAPVGAHGGGPPSAY